LKSGNELWVNREIVSNDLVISEGFIEPHWLAGFSGGRKSIIPGVAGWKTIMNNHSAHNVDHPKCRAGILNGNPAHEEFMQAAKMSGLKFILNVALDEQKRITNAFTGETLAAHEQGCEFVREHTEVPAVPADIVITSNGGYPLDINFYQAVKGLDTASRVVKQDGIIIICTECRERIGQRNFYDIFKQYRDPKLILQKLRAKEIEMIDQWSTQIIARIIINCQVFVVSEFLTSEELMQMGMSRFTDLQSAVSEALAIKGKQASISLIPEGPLVLPVISQ
jgi:nickel-dependent lactate racemase